MPPIHTNSPNVYIKDAWNALGDLLGGSTTVIGGHSYTNKDCYLKALDIDPCCKRTWCILGHVLSDGATAYVGGIYYNQMDCYMEVLKDTLQSGNGTSSD